MNNTTFAWEPVNVIIVQKANVLESQVDWVNNPRCGDMELTIKVDLRASPKENTSPSPKERKAS
ncbi:MAG: hypothetical protein GX660_01475 [Clostridiaceae bacterium]|nr:hypothetical protein [Clostridiaceae bacterium]